MEPVVAASPAFEYYAINAVALEVDRIQGTARVVHISIGVKRDPRESPAPPTTAVDAIVWIVLHPNHKHLLARPGLKWASIMVYQMSESTYVEFMSSTCDIKSETETGPSFHLFRKTSEQ